MKRIIVIKLGVSDGGGSGSGYYGMEVLVGRKKLTNMIIAGFAKIRNNYS